MDSNDNLLFEIQALRKSVEELTVDLRRISRKTSRHRTDPRKQVIATLIQANPKITNSHICRDLDKLQDKSTAYAPPRSWNSRLWSDAYHQVNNRVHSYISAIRRSLR